MNPLRVRLTLGLAALALAAGGSVANGFGTWDSPVIPGYAEHERITRMAIDCSGHFATTAGSPLAEAGGDCTQPRTTLMIAGGTSYLGGVGAPDSAYDSVIDSKSPQHCDDGDYLEAADYPRQRDARNWALMNCRGAFDRYMNDAVLWAGRIVPVVNGVPTLDVPQAVLTDKCNDDYDVVFSPSHAHGTGWAKCNALISFGRAMHMAEDFSSHSNWVDSAWPLSVAPIGLLNPPALGRPVGTLKDVPEFVRFPRSNEQLQAFLAANPVVTGAYTGDLSGRVTHSDRSTGLPLFRTQTQRGLNKDMGSSRINWQTGEIPKGKESRGLVVAPDGRDNFQRAVISAAATAAAGWSDLEAAVKGAYPGPRGEMAWRAMTHDTPWSACTFAGDAGKALAPSQPWADRARTVTVSVVNRTGQALNCGAAVLNWGEWTPIPPDQIASGATAQFRTQSAPGGVAGTEGRVTFAVGGSGQSATITWDNPLLGSNRYSCPTTGGLTCSWSGGKGNDSSIVVTIGGPARTTGVRLADGKDGTRAQGAALRADERERLAPPPVDTPMSAVAVRAIPKEVVGLRACEGRGARISLATDDVSCRWALGALKRLSHDLCPPGWSYRPVPEGHAVLCHKRLPQSSGATGDARAKAFRYVQPHFMEGHRH